MSDPIVKRTRTRTVVGMEVSELGVNLLCDANTTAGNVPLTQFAAGGGFDGATIEVNRFFASDWQSAACGSLNMFSGDIAEVDVDATMVTLNCKSKLQRLNIKLPRNMFQAGCVHTLYDEGCTLNPASFTVTGSVSANSTTSVIYTDRTENSGHFDLGTITISGVTRSVRSYNNTGGAFEVVPPLPTAPAAATTFTAKPGCDKQKATCENKFSNVVNFRGFPFIPVPEAST